MSSTLHVRALSKDDTTAPRPYALGYSEGEFKRLEQQSRILGELTEDVLRRAGIGEGMTVLDVGCGVGDVSLLAARLVGSSGAVLGIDRSPEAVATATRRAQSAGQAHVRFAAGSVDEFHTQEKFDAIIGRLILMYLDDRAATLRRLAGCLRRGGIVAFQEMVMPQTRTAPEGPQFRRCREWLVAAFTRAGFEVDMGSKLFATFLAAGLPSPHVIMAGRVESGPQSPAYDYIANTLRSLLPMIEAHGVATAAEVDIDTVAQRVRTEVTNDNACIFLPPMVGAWARLPG
jgi:ubiquinone/menaquinone biosynthesis C-methylase UbiE